MVLGSWLSVKVQTGCLLKLDLVMVQVAVVKAAMKVLEEVVVLVC